jgi:WD40 repeat protein
MMFDQLMKSIRANAVKQYGPLLRGAVLMVSLGLLLPFSAWAQEFGRNKVQYENFDFKTLDTEHFRIYLYLKEEKAARHAAAMMERWHQRLSRIFGIGLPPQQPVIFYGNHPDFQQTNAIFGLIPQGVRGVTEGLKNRVVMPLTGVPMEDDHVLGHELVHAFQYASVGSQTQRLSLGSRLPLWLVEGMAEYLSLGPSDPLTAMWMRDAVLTDDVPTISDVSRNPKYFPYRYGHAIWSYLAGRYGDRIVPQLFLAATDHGWPEGLKKAVGYDEDSLSIQWYQEVRDLFGSQIEGRQPPEEVAEILIAEEGGMNLSPALSPDGRYLAFLSRRGLFTIDLYLADVGTGEVLMKLASSETDRHFDALSFMNSSGCWSPQGDRFALPVVQAGKSRIVIRRVPSGETVRTIDVPEVDEILHMDWSPDGRRLVLSGISGGLSDLFLLELEEGQLERLTDDLFADLQPAWSPDGRTIAFATDRVEEGDSPENAIRAVRIGLLDLHEESFDFVTFSGEAKHINPQFSPDGRDMYFVADPDGFSDLYRYNVQGKSIFRVTTSATGISGLTKLSPPFSVARNSGRIALNQFQGGEYDIYLLEPGQARGRPVQADTLVGDRPGAALISADLSAGGRMKGYSGTAEESALEPVESTLSDYRPSLELIYLGQTTIGVSVDRFGTQLGGGASLLFSDILGDHLLTMALQANGGYKDLGGQAVYQNRNRRINWGAGLAHLPYQTAYMSSGTQTVTVDGQQILARRLDLIRQRVYIDRINLMAEYPFSRNHRSEFALGYSRISYDFELEQWLTTFDGYILSQETTDLDAPAGLNLVQGSVAYVGDTSYFGFTSPVRGSRFRLEAEPTVGSLQFLSVLADIRGYHFWRPVTLAWRLMHQGRYLGDAESDRLTSLMLGFETWVRGYSLDSFDASECTETDDPDRCPEFDRLIGSRVGIMNLELRFPVFGTEEYGLINYPYFPTELLAFVDGGVAWTKNDRPDFELTQRSSKRIPVFSTGLAARINLFGYLVAQIYYAYPFQRPDKGAHFGFLFAPGW